MCLDDEKFRLLLPPDPPLSKAQAAQYSPLTLAFLGDAVYSLFTRTKLVLTANRPARKLHRDSLEFVSACAQSAALKNILPLLTEEEEAVFRRGRNAHPAHQPKNQSEADYRNATGLETLFGYLYLMGEEARLTYIFERINGEDHEKEANEGGTQSKV